MSFTQEDLLNLIMEETQKEVSYDDQLEQQKRKLLGQREVEDWKRIVYETERCRHQYLKEYRLSRKQRKELYTLTNQLNDPPLEIIIDQCLGPWVEERGKPIDHKPEIDRVRAKVGRMKQRVLTYEERYEQIQKSKSHQMAMEISRKVRDEEIKVEERQKEMDDMWKASRVEANKEWEIEKKVYVGLCELYIEFGQIERDDEATLQNNEIKRAKIVQLHEEIKQAKIEQEEEAKRREIELSERLLIPVKIKHMTLANSVFKDPNDFPVLIDKIESTRKSYEQIFKRPEYVDLSKMRKKKRQNQTKSSSRFALLFSAPKRKDKSRKAATQPTVTKDKQPTANKVETVVSIEPQKEPEPLMEGTVAVPEPMKLEQPVASVERPSSKCPPKPSKRVSQHKPSSQTPKEPPQDVPAKVSKRKSLEDAENLAVEEQRKPVCNVQGQQVKQSSAQSMSQPVRPTESRDKSKLTEQPRKKRSSTDAPISSSAPTCVEDIREQPKKSRQVQQLSPEPHRRMKHKKVVILEPEQKGFEFEESESFGFSPEKPNRKTKPAREEQCPASPTQTELPKSSQPSAEEPMDHEPAPQQQQQPIEDDNFSFGSASPPPGGNSNQGRKGDGDFLDTVSLSGGSISSFDMDDRESGSDLGFDLSPAGPRANNRKGGSDASNEADSDFDFLASPPGKSSGVPAGKKAQESFDFMGGDDSGTGFDFF